jgi:hypothetical protein
MSSVLPQKMMGRSEPWKHMEAIAHLVRCFTY